MRASIAWTLLLGAMSYDVVRTAEFAAERAPPSGPRYLVVRLDQTFMFCVSQMRGERKCHTTRTHAETRRFEGAKPFSEAMTDDADLYRIATPHEQRFCEHSLSDDGFIRIPQCTASCCI